MKSKRPNKAGKKSARQSAQTQHELEGAIARAKAEALPASSSIRDRAKTPKQSIDDYLKIGEYCHLLKQEEPSTKLRGLRRKGEAPELYALGASMLSDCTHLYEALNGIRDEDLLEVLAVSNIRHYYSQNPTVIIRDYRNLKKGEASRKGR